MDQLPVSVVHLYCDFKVNFIDMTLNREFKNKIALHYTLIGKKICFPKMIESLTKNTLKLTFFHTVYDSNFLMLL